MARRRSTAPPLPLSAAAIGRGFERNVFARVASHLSPLTPPIGDLRGSARRSVGDLFRELSRVLDPALPLLLGRQKPDQLPLLVALPHGLGKPARIAISQLLHRVHAG